jgi:N-methylhydantoinase A
MATHWIGIDTGGTFTDLVLRHTRDGASIFHKVPTRTADPAQGILDGIQELLELAAVPAADVEFVVLGTTLATNAVLEGKWARTGMLTTRGFADVLDIARQRRPHYFNLDIPKPVPPSVRAHRHEVAGRLSHDGQELTALDEDAIRAGIMQLRDAGVESIAICFMHSYANDAHEQRALALLRQLWPQVYACASADVLPEFREYERFVTTTVNASLMPIMDRYLERFEIGVRDLGVVQPARVMQSNGGAVTTATVRRLPVNTFFSGPAGGVMATVAAGHDTNADKLIAFDMGGTSTDVSLIKDRQPSLKSERSMGGLPVRAPTMDIHTIGAGGGSLAWIDAGGMLKVGPSSAGAYPGPAAYGRGGTQPTVTDANVLLGRLSPVSLLDGRMKVFPENAACAIRDTVAVPLGLDEIDAAVGILQIATVHMTEAVRVISVERGEDPRDYTLVAFGGAGPLHAVDVALAAGMRGVIVPPRPGLFSAQGLLQADQRGDFSMTRLVPLETGSLPVINEGYKALQSRADAWLADEGGMGSGTEHRVWKIDIRYMGQSSELSLDLEGPHVDARTLRELCRAFNQRHEALFGYQLEGHGLEVVSLRAAVTIAREKGPTASIDAAPQPTASAAESRRVWFAPTGFIETPVIRRETLGAGSVCIGPAVIEQMDTTTVVPPGARVRVDDHGYLHIDLEPLLATAGVLA